MSPSARQVAVAALFVLLALGVASSTWAQSPALPARQAAAEAEPVEVEPLLVVKISERLLTDLLREPIRENTAVNTVILGAPVDGQAFTYGRLYFDAVESNEGARFWLLFAGYNWSNTVAHRPPAHVHSSMTTRFVTGKEFTYDTADELDFHPARIIADSDRRTRGISASVPGLRGAIVRHVATKRLSQQSGAIDWAADRHAKERVKQSFDRQVQQRLGNFRERLSRITPMLEASANRRGYVWKIATDNEYLLVTGAERPTDDAPVSRKLAELNLPTPPRQSALIEVWQHNRFDVSDAETIERGFSVLQVVLRVLSRSEELPPDWKSNLELLADLNSDVSKHQHWNLLQIHDEKAAAAR